MFKSLTRLEMAVLVFLLSSSVYSNSTTFLVENGILNYIVTGYYNPNKKYLGITPLDSKLNLPWDMTTTPIISEKDKGSLSYDEVISILESDVK